MELVKGGDLFDRIIEKGKYTELLAKQVMKNILSAVDYLHSKRIIHRKFDFNNYIDFLSNQSCITFMNLI